MGEAAGAVMLIQAIRALLRFLKPYPHVLPTVAVLGVVASLAEGLGIGLLIPFLSSLTDTQAASGGMVARWVDAYAALFPADARLIIVAATIALLVMLSCAVNFVYVRVLSRAATRVTHDLRTALFSRFVNSDQLFLEAGSQGRQVKAIDGSAFRAGQAVISLCLLIVNACTVLVILTLLALMSWKMTAFVLLAVGAAALVVRAFVARSMRTSARFERSSSALNDTTMQVLSSLRMVRIFGQERREAAHFDTVSDAVRGDQLTLEVVRRAMAPLVDALAAPLLIAGLVLATYADVSVVVLLPFLLLVFRLQRYVRELDVSRVRIAADAGAIFEVADLLQLPTGSDGREYRPCDALCESVSFESVSFVHPSAEPRSPSVQGLDLTIRHGETIGVVGGSGAGKSTLINLLCGIHRPTSGSILVDGTDLALIDMAAWRARLGFAGQDAELRPGTIAENIAYGEPDATPEAIRHAASQAAASDFIDALPLGYETPVGVRGMQLSGGERQRIALARALLRKPDLLILDEATNAVDNATEAMIRQALESLAGSLTMIIIAHRLSSIRHADRVVVMAGGRIVEQGTPDELKSRRGAFAELSRLDDIAPPMRIVSDRGA